MNKTATSDTPLRGYRLRVMVQELLESWHEAKRADFEAGYDDPDTGHLIYERDYPKTSKERRKYICLDDGGSGAFMVDKDDLMIYGIKGYGVPHKGKRIGKLGEVTGQDLYRSRRY